jgi:uncharacterized Zn finger protein
MQRNQLAIIELLNEELIGTLAIPSNIRRGRAIFERGGVQVIEQTADMVDAWVGGLDGPGIEGVSQRRRSQLFVDDTGKVARHCVGNPRDHQIFCKHCVALALTLLRDDNFHQVS